MLTFAGSQIWTAACCIFSTVWNLFIFSGGGWLEIRCHGHRQDFPLGFCDSVCAGNTGTLPPAPHELLKSIPSLAIPDLSALSCLHDKPWVSISVLLFSILFLFEVFKKPSSLLTCSCLFLRTISLSFIHHWHISSFSLVTAFLLSLSVFTSYPPAGKHRLMFLFCLHVFNEIIEQLHILYSILLKMVRIVCVLWSVQCYHPPVQLITRHIKLNMIPLAPVFKWSSIWPIVDIYNVVMISCTLL